MFQTNNIVYWNVEDTISNPETDLGYAKTGVFRTVGCEESFHLMSKGILPKLYWEWQTLSSIGKDGVYAVKSERKAKYRGSKKQHKHLCFDVYQSSLIITRHALARYYQRSGTTPQKPDHFFVDRSGWVGHVDASNELVDQGIIRTDCPLPFGFGAFLGEMLLTPCGGEVEHYEFNEFGQCIKGPKTIFYRPTFFAHTFIHSSMMTTEQKHICKLIEQRSFREAQEIIQSSEPRDYRTFKQYIQLDKNGRPEEIKTVAKACETHTSNDRISAYRPPSKTP